VDPSLAKRIAELEHLLELERARREAIEAGLDRLSERCHTLARENAALRERLGAVAPLAEPV
jgi:regulator of replication initiation timing